MKATTRNSAGWPSKAANKPSGKLRANNPPKAAAPAPKPARLPKPMKAEDVRRIKQSETKDPGFIMRADRAVTLNAESKPRR